MQKADLALDTLATLMRNEKAASGKSPKTLAWYDGALNRYSAWLTREELPATLGSFTLERVRAYIVALQRQPKDAYHPWHTAASAALSDHSINSYVRALRAFSSWLAEEGYTPTPLLARLKAPKMTQRAQDILTPEEITRIAAALNPRTERGARDQAIFLLLLDTGMRAGELCSLTLDRLHLEEGYAIVCGKGKKERPVKIGARVAKAVRFYLLHWRVPARGTLTQVFLTCRGVVSEADAFASTGGEPLTVNALFQLFRRMGRAAGVERLHPHLLRHTFACLHLQRYRDPFALKSLLGHTTLAMTNHYCEAVKQMEVVQADRVSIVDGLQVRGLDSERRGRIATRPPAS